MIQNISAHEASLLLRKHQAQLIDVRESYEFMHEHIPFAISLPISECQRWLPWVAEQTPTVWILQCLKGVRSEKFAHLLHNLIPGDSAHHIYVLEGGLERWAQAGLETVKGINPEEGCSTSVCSTAGKDKSKCCGPAYKDPIQRKLNLTYGTLILVSRYYFPAEWALCLLWILGAALIINSIIARCFFYDFLSMCCSRKKRNCVCGSGCEEKSFCQSGSCNKS